MITIRFDAGNSRTGNPRRVFVTFHNGQIVATYDEGYHGPVAITDPQHRAAYNGLTLETTPREYRELCKLQA